MFGRPPHAFATLAYTAVILANASSLALGTPKYDRRAAHHSPAASTAATASSASSPTAAASMRWSIKEVTAGGSRVVDTAKL